MRNILIGIAIGAAATLTLGAVNPGRYQVAATVAPDAGVVIVRVDTQTGEISACRRLLRDTPLGGGRCRRYDHNKPTPVTLHPPQTLPLHP